MLGQMKASSRCMDMYSLKQCWEASPSLLSFYVSPPGGEVRFCSRWCCCSCHSCVKDSALWTAHCGCVMAERAVFCSALACAKPPQRPGSLCGLRALQLLSSLRVQRVLCPPMDALNEQRLFVCICIQLHVAWCNSNC